MKLRHKIFAQVIKYLTFVFLNLLGLSLKFQIHNKNQSEKVIYAFWHRNILPLMYLHRNQNVAIIISASHDGEYVAKPAEIFGFKPVRGSSNKFGVKAVKSMFNHTEGAWAITPDGPKGPYKTFKKGLFYLAYLSKMPIVGVVVDTEKAWKMNKSWDNFRIPKPGATIDVYYTDPVFINSKDEIEKKSEELLAIMRKEKD